MSNIIINSRNRTIELTTKKFAAAASRFKTDAYDELQAARRDYPDFRVVVKSSRGKKNDRNKGLTFAYMERYIKAHDDENGSVMATFKMLRGTSEEGKKLGAGSASYDEVKTWFDQQFPEFAAFQKKREELLEKIAAKKEAAKNAAAAKAAA